MFSQLKIFSSFLLTVSFVLSQASQQYQPSWESPDKHPIPEWFLDVKFGIFIN